MRVFASFFSFMFMQAKTSESALQTIRRCVLKKNVALSVLPLVLLCGMAYGQSPDSVPAKLDAIQAKIDALAAQNSSLTTQVTALTTQVASLAASNKGPRQFYLTKNTYDGAHALTACNAGYHMASLWEIFDTTNLRYNTELGLTRQDSGFGVPAGAGGWIRTGVDSSIPGNDAGSSNCHTWTSNTFGDNGTFLELVPHWNNSPGIPGGLSFITPWVSDTFICPSAIPVWCVQD
jgi:hypothetical protein